MAGLRKPPRPALSLDTTAQSSVSSSSLTTRVHAPGLDDERAALDRLQIVAACRSAPSDGVRPARKALARIYFTCKVSRVSRHRSLVQGELQQRRPFASTSAEAAVALLRTADVLRRFYERTLAPHRITLAQYNVLRILRGAGADGLPTLDVAARLVEEAPGITLMMRRLERRGWIRRQRSASDARQVRCYLTRTGHALVNRLDATIDAADERALEELFPAQQRQLIELLDTIRDPIREKTP